MFTTRSDCLHLMVWSGAPPRVGDVAWCQRCAGFSKVTYLYLRPGAHMPCGARAKGPPPGRFESYCSLAPRHPGGHYDVATGRAWGEPLEPAA